MNGAQKMDPLENLFLVMQRPLIHFFRVHGLPEDDAEACTNEVFLRFLKGGYSPSPPILWRIARNILVDRWRAQKAEKKRTEEMATERDNESDPPSDKLEHLEVIEILRKALQRLPPEQRIVIKMKTMEEIDLGQISKVLGISEEAAKGRYRRGLANLEKDLRVRRLAGA